MTLFRALLVIGILAGIVFAILSLGNPQWNRYIYAFQSKHIEKELLSPPSDYTGEWVDWDYNAGTFHCLKIATYDQGSMLASTSFENGVRLNHCIYESDESRSSGVETERYEYHQPTGILKAHSSYELFPFYNTGHFTQVALEEREFDESGELVRHYFFDWDIKVFVTHTFQDGELKYIRHKVHTREGYDEYSELFDVDMNLLQIHAKPKDRTLDRGLGGMYIYFKAKRIDRREEFGIPID